MTFSTPEGVDSSFIISASTKASASSDPDPHHSSLRCKTYSYFWNVTFVGYLLFVSCRIDFEVGGKRAGVGLR